MTYPYLDKVSYSLSRSVGRSLFTWTALVLFVMVFGILWMMVALVTSPLRLLDAADKIGPRPCPHGYEDWDRCPDCCH